jgi:hypothetical protein
VIAAVAQLLKLAAAASKAAAARVPEAPLPSVVVVVAKLSSVVDTNWG